VFSAHPLRPSGIAEVIKIALPQIVGRQDETDQKGILTLAAALVLSGQKEIDYRGVMVLGCPACVVVGMDRRTIVRMATTVHMNMVVVSPLRAGARSGPGHACGSTRRRRHLARDRDDDLSARGQTSRRSNTNRAKARLMCSNLRFRYFRPKEVIPTIL
jgi:hypothetical protein